MLEFMGKRPIRKNLTIEPIPLSDEQNQQLEKIMKSEKASVYKHWKVRSIIMNITGITIGYCSCGKLPTHVLKYHVSKVTLVQKYCENCLKKEGLIV